jgi:hypothetical protein
MTNSNPFSQTAGIRSNVNDVKQIGYGIVTDVQPNNNLTVTLQFLADDSAENNSTRCPVMQPSSGSVVLPNEGDLAIYAATSNGAPVVLGTVSDEAADIPEYTADETKIKGLNTGVTVENDASTVLEKTTGINFGSGLSVSTDGDGTVTVTTSGDTAGAEPVGPELSIPTVEDFSGQTVGTQPSIDEITFLNGDISKSEIVSFDGGKALKYEDRTDAPHPYKILEYDHGTDAEKAAVEMDSNAQGAGFEALNANGERIAAFALKDTKDLMFTVTGRGADRYDFTQTNGPSIAEITMRGEQQFAEITVTNGAGDSQSVIQHTQNPGPIRSLRLVNMNGALELGVGIVDKDGEAFLNGDEEPDSRIETRLKNFSFGGEPGSGGGAGKTPGQNIGVSSGSTFLDMMYDDPYTHDDRNANGTPLAVSTDAYLESTGVLQPNSDNWSIYTPEDVCVVQRRLIPSENRDLQTPVKTIQFGGVDRNGKVTSDPDMPERVLAKYDLPTQVSAWAVTYNTNKVPDGHGIELLNENGERIIAVGEANPQPLVASADGGEQIGDGTFGTGSKQYDATAVRVALNSIQAGVEFELLSSAESTPVTRTVPLENPGPIDSFQIVDCNDKDSLNSRTTNSTDSNKIVAFHNFYRVPGKDVAGVSTD